MNGLLTALLGGASGIGQAATLQNERALRIAEAQRAQQALNLERDKFALDAAMQGGTLAALNGGGSGADGGTPDGSAASPMQPAPVSQMPAAPSAPMGPMGPSGPAPQYLPSSVNGGGPRPMVSVGGQNAGGTPSAAPGAAPGAVPAIDVMRSTVPQSSAANPSASSSGFNLADYMNRNINVNLPSLGGQYRFNLANSPFGRSILAKQYEMQQQAEMDIYKALMTGQIDRNQAETQLARLQTDPNYIRGKAAAEAQGRLGSEESLENLRFGHQQQLQGNQQQFTAGQNTAQRSFEQGQQARQLAGSFVNQSALEQQRGNNGIAAALTGRHIAAPASAIAPSNAITDPAALEQQRLDWDTAAASLRAQKKSPDAVLGPRP